MRFCVVDDEETVREKLKEYIDRYYDGQKDKYSVTFFGDGMNLVTNFHPEYDVIFLDIEMKLLDGMRTAKRIRQSDENVIIIFITNMARYALKGYEVDALDFMIKPVSYNAFSATMKRAEKIINRTKGQSIMINCEGKIKILSIWDICYVEVTDHWLIYYLKDTSYKVRGSMKNLLDQFQGLPFSLCSRSFLVNLKYVTEISGDILWISGYELKISRTKKKEFMSALSDYLGGTY